MSSDGSLLAQVRVFETPTTMKHGIGAISVLPNEARQRGMGRP
jgi:hypothetical protein